MALLADRIRWILAKREWTARELSRRAGLQETHISSILRRLDADPEYSIALSTAVSIADASDISIEWLAKGEGPAETTSGSRLDPYPLRQRAIRAARELALSEEAIASVLAEDVPDGSSKSPRWWFDRIAAKHVLFSPEENITPEPGTVPTKSDVRPKTHPPPSTKKSGRK